MSSVRVTLARNLARLMAESDTLRSQNALAKKSKVGQTTIGNWLRLDSPTKSPTLDTVESVARALGVSVGELLSADGNRNAYKDEEWTGFDHPERLTAALIDWGEKASPTSKLVISELVDHVHEGDLPDDFWETIGWLAKRYNNKTK